MNTNNVGSSTSIEQTAKYVIYANESNIYSTQTDSFKFVGASGDHDESSYAMCLSDAEAVMAKIGEEYPDAYMNELP